MMTQALWDKLSKAQKAAVRDYSKLNPQLTGLEGWRIEVVDCAGNKRRFIVGRSLGWQSVHLELKNRRSSVGWAAEREYQSVRMVEQVWKV